MQKSVQIYLPHLQIQVTGTSILFHYAEDKAHTCFTEQLGNFQFIFTILCHRKVPTCCSAADNALPAFLLSPHSALGRLVVGTSWQKELCKAHEQLPAPANSYFWEAAKTISQSGFKTQHWNSLELPVRISRTHVIMFSWTALQSSCTHSTHACSKHDLQLCVEAL